jgi:GR25 family glycosyltransferase involved in LPS biosynthesis
MKTKIINLARRTDRWNTVVPEVRKFGVGDFERFDAVDGGYLGFNQSMHFALENEGEMLLLEDDVVFRGTIDDLLVARAELPDDWDLLYLGATLRSTIQRYSGRLYRISDAWTSHAILYSDKGAQYCFENFDPAEGTIYDEWLRLHAQVHLQCFIIYPMLAVQADGWSDIWRTNVCCGMEDNGKNFV